MYFYGARWYDPAVGRFTGVDPIAVEFAHVSGYNYAENDPVGYVDLWGLQKAISVIQIGKNSEGNWYVNSTSIADRPAQGYSRKEFTLYGNTERYGVHGHLYILENLETGITLSSYEPEYFLGLFEMGTPQKGGIEVLGYAGDGSWDGAVEGYAQTILDFSEFFLGGQSAGFGQKLIRRGQVAEKIAGKWVRFLSPETVSAARTFIEKTKGVQHGINTAIKSKDKAPKASGPRVTPWLGSSSRETTSGRVTTHYDQDGNVID